MAVTEVIRLTHPRFFSREHGRFSSSAFRIYGDGASVICTSCVGKTGASLCAHIAQYYRGVGGEPPVFKRYKTSEFGTGARLEACPSTSGDPCHYDLKGLTNGQLRNLMKSAPLDSFEICAPDGLRNLAANDTKDWP